MGIQKRASIQVNTIIKEEVTLDLFKERFKQPYCPEWVKYSINFFPSDNKSCIALDEARESVPNGEFFTIDKQIPFAKRLTFNGDESIGELEIFILVTPDLTLYNAVEKETFCYPVTCKAQLDNILSLNSWFKSQGFQSYCEFIKEAYSQ